MDEESNENSPLLAPATEEEAGKFCCFKMNKKKATLAKTICGYLLVINAGLLFTLANVIQKIVAPQLVFWHLLAYRAIGQIVVMSGDLCLRNVDPRGPPGRRRRITFQGLLGGCLLLCIFVAVKHVPLGSASAIFFCTPVFTFALAVTMLGERMGAYRVLISALMIVGVVLITRPPFIFPPDVTPNQCHNDHHRGDNSTGPFSLSSPLQHGSSGCHHTDFSVMGYVCAIAVPLLSAVCSIITRQLKDLRPSIIMFWFGVGSLVVSIGGIIAFKAGGYFSYSFVEACYIFVISALGMLGNISYTFAVRWVSPSKGNVFRSFEVILNYVLQLVLEHSVFHSSSIVGISLLLSAVVFTGFENEAMERFRTRFWFL